MKYDICIALRVYPGIIDNQKVFCDDKFLLYKKSLNSLVGAIGKLNPFIYILLDNCPREYENYTESIVNKFDHEIIKYDKKQGNSATFKKQIELLKNQNYSDICLFLEDDYLHLPGSIEKFVIFMKNHNVEFGTTYNSIDFQKMLIHNYRPEFFYYNNCVYGVYGSTTMTFFCTKKSLNKYIREITSYTRGNHDFSMWFGMTKLGICNFGNILKALFTDFPQFKLFGYIWYRYIYEQNNKTPKTKLYVPLLSGATHIDKKGLSDGINWNDVWNGIKV